MNQRINMNDSAYLELIIGPMFSGKTSRLIEIYKQYNFCNIPVMVINHSLDDRYDNELLSSHDKIMIPCIKVSELYNINKCYAEQFNNSNIIIINEGQFFNDLYDWVDLTLKLNKKIYVCGLDGDFEQKKFGKILDLIPLCDKVTKLTSLCNICKNGTPGIFSMRITNDKIQTLIGYDNYIPVCRKCFNDNIV
jgi:thymidine kinase